MTTSQQRLSREQINIWREVGYIVSRAAERDVRIVTLGSLVFFSTESGDAWLLDPGEQLALCLARDGDPQPIHLGDVRPGAAGAITSAVRPERT